MVALLNMQIESFLALMLGFSCAMFAASLYRAWLHRPASFAVLFSRGGGGLVALPFLAVVGPAIIMRNTILGRRYEQRKLHFIALSTAIAAFWSIMIGYQILHVLTSFIIK